MVETMVFHVRDPKDLMELSLEDSASSVTSPGDMLATSTPVNHIKLERFGKSSVVLARCPASENGPAPDQSAYEPLFAGATAVIGNYRSLLNAEPPGSRRNGAHQRRAAAKVRPSSKLRKPIKPTKIIGHARGVGGCLPCVTKPESLCNLPPSNYIGEAAIAPVSLPTNLIFKH